MDSLLAISVSLYLDFYYLLIVLIFLRKPPQHVAIYDDIAPHSILTKSSIVLFNFIRVTGAEAG
jgi:hypothetical protein